MLLCSPYLLYFHRRDRGILVTCSLQIIESVHTRYAVCYCVTKSWGCDVLQGPNRVRAPFVAGVSAGCFSEVPLRQAVVRKQKGKSQQWCCCGVTVKPCSAYLQSGNGKSCLTSEEQTVLFAPSYLLMALFPQVLIRSLRMCSERAELLCDRHFS